MNKRNKNIAIGIASCSDKISVGNKNVCMFQIAFGVNNKQEHLSIATILLDVPNAFALKQKLIGAKNSLAADINFICDEIHIAHFHSDPEQRTHWYYTDDVHSINLESDTIVAMTSDTIKSWNKLKSSLVN